MEIETTQEGELFEALIQLCCSTRAQEALASSSLIMMAGIDKSLAGFTQSFFPVYSLVSKASLKSISTTNVNDRCSLSAIA
ncbi:hypothetical protein [Phormidium tenue]|uniref:hypothetical protein n=1 Tax=Phormidium tenue TaxID=126344 RepID=UPI00111525F0|nr:hypothetical protein [Phormidium tenue]MBD2230779.1 hypothetical protein [Phormidium tenue FACHB-1052]